MMARGSICGAILRCPMSRWPGALPPGKLASILSMCGFVMQTEIRTPVLSAAVDELCDRFEDALLAGDRPGLDSWLAEAGHESSAALPELAALDLDDRCRAGESVGAAEYFSRFPQLLKDRSSALRLVSVEFRAASARQPHLSEADFRVRYPELAGLPDWSNGPWVA